jgi:4-hydroxy-tetrahydrodipicolinate reductase
LQFGAVAQWAKAGVEIVGICDLTKTGEFNGVPIKSDIGQVIADKSCDVVLLCTDSFTAGAFPKIEFLLNKGVNVITIAEEMSWPAAQQPELAAKIDELAKANGVSVLGTGINPGFAMDLLAIMLSAVMVDVKTVECKRVNSLSPFGLTVMEEQGVGLSPSEFEAKNKEGKLAGHVGFAESIAMLAQGIGLEIDEFKQQMKPIITDVDRKSDHGTAKAGHLAGVNMTAQGLRGGKVIIDMAHPQQIEPHLANVTTGDYITLTGSPNVTMAISPEISGGLGTIAMAINCIPHVINADPGLITMLDIPVPRAIMGDYRALVKEGKKVT